MANKMNICLISREFPPDTAFGGIATFSIDTALMLQSHGHQVTVFSQSLGPSHVTDYQGVRVHKVHVPWPFGSYRVLPVFILAFNFVIMREVKRSHKQNKFDLIDAPDHLAEGLFATLFSSIPVVTRLHTPYSLIVGMGLNNYKKGISYYLIKLFEKIALRQSRALYAPCKDLIRRCDELFSIGLIPNKIFGYPLDLKMFSIKESEHQQNQLRILFLGRLEQRKGIETIIEAFPKLMVHYPKVTLTLLGRDTPNIHGFSSAREYMQNGFESAGCAENVSFEEYVPLEQLPEIFHKHDIVWVPSMYDNFPIVCLEAMACGKSVVVSDSGGLPEMIQHGETGMVFSTGNADELCEFTRKLCEDSGLRLKIGKNARFYVEKNCSTDAIYAKTMELYELALANP